MTTSSLMKRDPVCGMMVNVADAPAVVHMNEQTWVFCSDSCRREFEADPTRFVRDVPNSPDQKQTAADQRPK